jgi:hypothetical protein
MKTILLLNIFFLTCLNSSELIESYQNSTFSITPPKAEISQDGVVVTMMMPPTNGFSSNVYVMVQTFANSINEYDTITQNQIKSMKFRMIDSKISENEIIYEYKGKSGQLDLHWYARVVIIKDKIYLITATSLDSNWETNKSELMKSVQSFKMNK